MPEQLFTITEDHLKLVQQMYFNYDAACEFGAACVDPKRPYGNSDVFYDIAEILNIKGNYDEDEEYTEFTEEQEEIMMKLHKSMKTVLQIVTRTLSFETGHYAAQPYSQQWRKVAEL